jgi:arylsulfatase A-like enzyme
VLAGPGYTARQHSPVAILDIAPTVLQHFGIPPTARMRGRPIPRTIEHRVPVSR